jgi:Amt family ammonium transporter
MSFFSFRGRGKCRAAVAGFLWSLFLSATLLHAQSDMGTAVPDPDQVATGTNLAATNAPSANPLSASPALPLPARGHAEIFPTRAGLNAPPTVARSILGALVTLFSLTGFLLYYVGLGHARNSGHTAMLLLVGVFFALAGYWIGGFGVQTGGVGDSHAALVQPFLPAEKSALNHELGFIALGHHWGLMGSSAFFLASDDSARNGIAALFLIQAASLIIAVAAFMGAAVERARLLPMAICAFLGGVLIYPLLANWVWGGGWLAELGREFGLGHGFVDLGGAAVVHGMAGTLALVLAVTLGPRQGRFGRTDASPGVPAHHVPFVALGSSILLISWMSTNAFASAALVSFPAQPGAPSSAGPAAINTLLAATAGLMTSFVVAAWKKRRTDPVRLCRGMLAGAVASCGCAPLIDSWAAFVIGGMASLIAEAALGYLERARIDDPCGASAVHGAAGAWGVLATGLFANGSAGDGLNDVAGPVRGLFFGGGWHQLAAQVIGCIAGFGIVYLLGYACVGLVQKIVGLRAPLADEIQGLDWPELGALGYQGDDREAQK